MPRPRTPTANLSASTLKQNPGRYASRANEPKPTGSLGNPPKYFTPERKKLWKEVVSRVPDGVLTASDTLAVETLVLLLEKQRMGLAKPVEIGHLRAMYSQFGLTPADRSRVSVPETPKADAFQQFLSEATDAGV